MTFPLHCNEPVCRIDSGFDRWNNPRGITRKCTDDDSSDQEQTGTMTSRATASRSTSRLGDEPDCLFCRMDDEKVNSVVDESTNFYARADNFPATRGHVEIVPKRHVVSFFDLTAADVAEAYDLMHRVQQKLNSEHHPDAYTIGVNDGRAAGRTIDHLHIHLVPRHEGDMDDPRGGIRKALPNFHPERWSGG